MFHFYTGFSLLCTLNALLLPSIVRLRGIIFFVIGSHLLLTLFGRLQVHGGKRSRLAIDSCDTISRTSWQQVLKRLFVSVRVL